MYAIWPICLLLTYCGNSGCRTAEEQYYGGMWEKTQFTKLKPINPNVIQHESDFGAYKLYEGTTEARAKENLWYEIKNEKGGDAIVKSGNMFTMTATGNMILSGTSTTMSVTNADYQKLNGNMTSTPEPVKVSKTIKNDTKPTSIIKTITYLANGEYQYDYEYKMKDEEGTPIILKRTYDKDKGQYIDTVQGLSATVSVSSSCDAMQNFQAKEQINYIWKYPKRIIFHKWPNADRELLDRTVIIDDVKCDIQDAIDTLWYVCKFKYDGIELQYKRRVSPVMSADGYPQFEEQVSVTEDKIIEMTATNNSDAKTIKCSSEDDCDYKDGSKTPAGPSLSDAEKKQLYYFCIVGGLEQNSDNSEFCSQYSFGKFYTATPVYRSFVLVEFKDFYDIYGSSTTKVYDSKCFQYDDVQNRFIPDSSKVASDEDCKDLSYQQLCRMAPKAVGYNLHKIKTTEYRQVWNPLSADNAYCSTNCLDKQENDGKDAMCLGRCVLPVQVDEGLSSHSDELHAPNVVSQIDYSQADAHAQYKRIGALPSDSTNTLYYSTDSSYSDNDGYDSDDDSEIELKTLNLWQAGLKCVSGWKNGDAHGYRRIRTGGVCSSGGITTTGYLTGTLCNEEQVMRGYCYNILIPKYPTKTSNHTFYSVIDGRDPSQEDDTDLQYDLSLVPADVYDESKPAYLANIALLKKDGYATIKIYPENNTDYCPILLGLIPVAGPDIENVNCSSTEFPDLELFKTSVSATKKPDKYDELPDSAKEKINVIPDDCTISGSYETWKFDNTLKFSKGTKGILPVKWSNFPVQAGQSIPLSISTQYPVLVKSRRDTTTDGSEDDIPYMALNGGNGLMVVIDPDVDEEATETTLSDPESWQCNVGTGGSYAHYRPYKYKGYKDLVTDPYNPRNIETLNSMWWFCDDEKKIWFSGYDYKNIKTAQPVYMHTYDTSDLVKFLPRYQMLPSVSHEDLAVENVGCNEYGLPSSMVIGGVVYSGDQISHLQYDTSWGPQYVYSDNDGVQHAIPVEDSSITAKVYEKYQPKMIIVDLADEGLTRVQIQASKDDMEYNNLVRTYKKNGDHIVQAYYEFDYFSKHYKIRVEDSAVHQPVSCYNEGEAPSEDTLSDDTTTELTDIRFTDDNKYYVLNSSNDISQIFTRYGPFTGMHLDTSGLFLPAIYSTEGACMDSFIYDEQHADSPEGYTQNMSWYGIPGTYVKRKNLSIPWRMEFTNPVYEDKSPDDNGGYISQCRQLDDAAICSQKDVPDVLLVDLSKTENAKKKKDIAGSVVVYKDENLIKYEQMYFYPITFPPLGWSNYNLDINDTRISSLKCGAYSNCADDETPIIELTVNGVSYRIEDGDVVNEQPVTIGKRASKTVISFELINGGAKYGPGVYKIEDPVLDRNALCFSDNTLCTSNVKGYLSQGMFKFVDTKDNVSYYHSLSKAPYMMACGTELNYAFPTGKAKYIDKTGYAIKSTIPDFTDNQYFARCVPSWKTDKWMLMEQPSDPSTFYTGFSAISGMYISKNNETLSKEDIEKKYHLTNAWKDYGGIVKNVIINQECDTIDAEVQKETNLGSVGKLQYLSSSGTTSYNVNCRPKNISHFNAEFKARYPRQVVMVRPIVNDPVNTHGTCAISISGAKNAKMSINMNSPFGFDNDKIKGHRIDRTTSESFEPEGKETVQRSKTVNGDGLHRGEFFKKSEFQRNLIGAGILTPIWQTVADENGEVIIFEKDDLIKFEAMGTYYASGALSHVARGYCAVKNDTDGILATVLYALALEAQIGAVESFIAGVILFKLGPPYGWSAAWPWFTAGIILEGVGMALAYASAQTVEKMSDVGEMKPEDNDKRACGVATAFKVVPIPQVACIAGYTLGCSNDRINKYVEKNFGTSINNQQKNSKIISYCNGEETVDFRTARMKIGQCMRHVTNITTYVQTSSMPQRYKTNNFKRPNTLIDAVGDWSELENIYEENCGVCVKRKNVYSYNGVSYSVEELPTLPSSVRTEEHCTNYSDENGNSYTWVKNIKIITPFDGYSYKNRTTVTDAVIKILSNKISACEPGNSYVMNLDQQSVKTTFENAFLKMQIRNKEACVSNMQSVYYQGIAESNTTDECKQEIQNDIEVMAQAACNDMLSIIQDVDGDDYSSYQFEQNVSSARCDDNKQVLFQDSSTGVLSVANLDSGSLRKIGIAELTTSTAKTSGLTTNLTLQVPNQIEDEDGKARTFKTAKLGFLLAGDASKDPLTFYRNYRMQNLDDLQRGYNVTIGSGLQVSNGKYMYFYIQPLNDKGVPNPEYNPNSYFSYANTDFTPVTVAENSMVYSFKDYDIGNTGQISLIAPRTGKLWVTVLDSAELAGGDKDADGTYIGFDRENGDGTMQVTASNVLYTNAGYYTVQANIQTDSDDPIDAIVAGDTKSGLNKLITSLVITNIKKIFIGDYVCKRCLKQNPSECEITSDNVSDSDWYTTEYKKVCDYQWDAGVLGKVATAFLTSHLVYIAWFLFVTFSVFIIGFQFITGAQKFDFKFMKKYLWRYALIMAFVNPQSLELYLRLCVRPAFNLAEGLSSFVASNFSSEKYSALDPQNFTYSAFGPVDKILKFWINKYTMEKLLAILFSSWTGIVCVILLLLCFIFFMICVIEAVMLYVIILIKMSLYLAIGPIVFLLLIHEKTAGKFTEWWKMIAGCIAEQVAMFAALSCFSTIYYYILKGSMNFIYCWEPVLKVPILDITLLSMWRISGTMPAYMAELSGSMGDDTSINTKGFNFLTAFMLFIVTCMMSKFVDNASKFGAKVFGQSSSMPGEIKEALDAVKGVVKDLPKQGAGMIKDKITKKNKTEEKRGGTEDGK